MAGTGRHEMGFQICVLVIADVGLTEPQCLLSDICHSSPSFKSAVGAVICLQELVHYKGLFHGRASQHPPEHRGN